MEIAIYTPTHSNRLQFAFEELFRYSPINCIKWIHNAEDAPTNILLINYSQEDLIVSNFTIRPSGLLGAQLPCPSTVEWYQDLEWPYAFAEINSDADWPFDLPAFIFYLLSRAEEYGAELDEYGRVKGEASQAALNGFLTIPILDLWRTSFLKALGSKYQLEISTTYPQVFEFTMDIDMAYAFRCQNLFRTLASFGADFFRGSFSTMRKRWRTIRGTAKDPFDTYEEICSHFPDKSGHLIFFFLLSNGSAQDRSCNPQHPDLRRLFMQLGANFSIGIHPSLKTAEHIRQLKKEVNIFNELADKNPIISRQHFLQLRFPDTYRDLLSVGIQHDYSMGYHDRVGYRAGTALPFKWYDLASETITDLWIHPFYAMDVTLKKYMRLSPDVALDLLKEHILFLRSQGLPFSCLWHNSSMSELMDWREWEEVPGELLTFLKNQYSQSGQA